MLRPVLFKRFAAAAAVVSLSALGAAAAPASAATPTIANNGNVSGQPQWLESFGTVGDGSVYNKVHVTVVVKHDPGRKVTGLRLDDDWNGSDNAATATLRDVSAIAQQNV